MNVSMQTKKEKTAKLVFFKLQTFLKMVQCDQNLAMFQAPNLYLYILRRVRTITDEMCTLDSMLKTAVASK